jgi:hypothetical protein
MEQVLRLMLEEREAARGERQANLATLQHLTQIATNHNNRGGNDEKEPRNQLRDFQNSNPPTFTKSTEPLDADDWLRTIENKLEYAGVGANKNVTSQDFIKFWGEIFAFVLLEMIGIAQGFKTF